MGQTVLEEQEARRKELEDQVKSVIAELRDSEVILSAAAEESARLALKTVISLNAGLLVTLAALISDPDRSVEMTPSFMLSCAYALIGIASGVLALDARRAFIGDEIRRVRQYRASLQGALNKIEPRLALEQTEYPKSADGRAGRFVVRLVRAGSLASAIMFLGAVVTFFFSFVA